MWKIDYKNDDCNKPLSEKWITRYMELAEHAAQWSKEWRTKVGAVIVSNDNRVVSIGYNGFPKDMEDNEEWYKDSEFKRKHVIHAETNACLNALSHGGRVDGSSIFITHPPCPHCIGTIKQAGIVNVFYRMPSDDFIERWPLKETLEHLERVKINAYVLK